MKHGPNMGFILTKHGMCPGFMGMFDGALCVIVNQLITWNRFAQKWVGQSSVWRCSCGNSNQPSKFGAKSSCDMHRKKTGDEKDGIWDRRTFGPPHWIYQKHPNSLQLPGANHFGLTLLFPQKYLIFDATKASQSVSPNQSERLTGHRLQMDTIKAIRLVTFGKPSILSGKFPSYFFKIPSRTCNLQRSVPRRDSRSLDGPIGPRAAGLWSRKSE